MLPPPLALLKRQFDSGERSCECAPRTGAKRAPHTDQVADLTGVEHGLGLQVHGMMAKLKRLGHENAISPASFSKGRCFGRVLGEGLFAEHGFYPPRIADLNPRLCVKSAPSADDGNVQLGLVEHGVELGITRCNAKFLAVAHELFGQTRRKWRRVRHRRSVGRPCRGRGRYLPCPRGRRDRPQYPPCGWWVVIPSDRRGRFQTCPYTCGLRSLGSNSRGRK